MQKNAFRKIWTLLSHRAVSYTHLDVYKRQVEIVGIKEESRKVVITGIEMFRKLLDEAQAGDNIGALLRGVQRTEIERGQVLAKPGSVHPVSYTHLREILAKASSSTM